METIVSIIFWFGFGVLLLFDSQFQYHEQLVGLAALLIGIVQIVTLWRKQG